MIDTHCHLLPAIDDGPKDMAATLKLAQAFSHHGVQCVITTPHWIRATRWAPSPALVLQRVQEVKIALQEAKIDLRVLPGMEIAYDAYLFHPFQTETFLPLGDSNAYLIEFPIATGISTAPDMLIKEFTNPQVRFVIAHPERCKLFQQSPELLQELVHVGAMTQLNIGSLIGHHGQSAKQLGYEIIRSGCAHFLASDAHNHDIRKPITDEEEQQLEALIGAKAVLAGRINNPRALLKNQTVTPIKVTAEVANKAPHLQKEIVAPPPEPPVRKTNLLKRIFG